MYGDDPPKDLKRYWRIQQYGDPWGSGWMNWPIGWMKKMSVLSSVYNAHSSMLSAGAKRVPWKQRNPEHSRITDAVFSMRKELKWRLND